MIFSQYSYKDYHNSNKSLHPIQPYCWDNWVKMVNDNERYCSKMNWIKWIELYFWILMRRVKKHELPSFHAYWKIQTNKEKIKLVKILEYKYKTCLKNPSLIKVLFNSNTKIEDIHEMIISIKKTLS